MSDTYADFRREPSKPHQCMHHSDEDGTRCRAIAMHNEHMCYHHRPDTILPVIENEPFLIESLDTREAIQKALGQVASQLACNRMDFQRARLLIHVITAAMRNLPPHPRPAPQSTPEPGCPVLTPLGRVTATQPATDTLQPATVPPPEREYTKEENDYFFHTIFARGFEPRKHERPPTVTDEDIIARVYDCRRSYGLPHLKPVQDPTGSLVALHELPAQYRLQPTPRELTTDN